MSEDFIDQTFAGLDVYYPGSKRKRREPPKPQERPEVDWSARSYKKTLPNGKEVEMYTLGSLAEALGRPLPTIRLWLKEGHLPLSPYRLPTTLGKHGKEVAGRRLYTRPMIEAAVEIFDRAGILSVTRVDWVANRQVTVDIDAAWSSIRAKETDQTETKE